MRIYLAILIFLWAISASADGLRNIGGVAISGGGGGGGGGGCAGALDLSAGCIIPGLGP